MPRDLSYKKEEKLKKIVFIDNEHRHVKLVLKLKNLNITQSKFFRHIVSGLLLEDPRIVSYVEDIVSRTKNAKKRTKDMKEKGVQDYNDLGFSEDEMDNIFDLIEMEYPDL